MVKHVYVIGLDESNLVELKTVKNAAEYEFHGLVPYETIVLPDSYPMEEIMAEARRTLREAPAVDAIIGHWDFPTTSMLPILRREWGLTTPTLESVLYCEHKYWNRLASQQAVPECTPPFQGVDPFDPDPLSTLELDYPFWLKPSVAFSSYLGFRIDNEKQFTEAVATIRENIGLFAEPFDYVVKQARNPEALPGTGSGATCVAEGIIQGELCTLEGYIYEGEVVVYAILDSLRGSNQVSFLSYQYPSKLPLGVQARMEAAAERLLSHIGLDWTPFNMEFFWDKEADKIWLLEVNPRISKSHCSIFRMVTGASHHEVAIDISLGRRPSFPRAEGSFPIAAKFMPRVYGDAVVTRVPSEDELAAIRRIYPDLTIQLHVEEGMRLADLKGQDSYSFEIADMFLGGDDEQQLHEKFREIMRNLDIRFSKVLPTNYG